MNRKRVIILVAIITGLIFLAATNLNLNPASARPSMGSNCAGCHGSNIPGTAPSKPAPTKPAPTKPAAKPTTPAKSSAKPSAKPAPATTGKATFKKTSLNILGSTGEVNVAIINGRAYISARDLAQILGAQAGASKDMKNLAVDYPAGGPTSCRACHPAVSSALPGVPCEACHRGGAAHAKAPTKTKVEKGGVNVCASCHAHINKPS